MKWMTRVAVSTYFFSPRKPSKDPVATATHLPLRRLPLPYLPWVFPLPLPPALPRHPSRCHRFRFPWARRQE